MNRTAAVAALAAGLGLLAPSAVLAQNVSRQLHELEWFVHDSMIDEGAGRGLGYYEQIIEEAIAHASGMLQGLQGPDDTPCCVELSAVSIETFSGAGLDVPSSASDWSALRSHCGSGSCAYLVESLAHCGGPTAAVGCADTPTCSGDPNDDPLLVLVVTMAAHDGGVLGDTLVHERGHNACLSHVGGDACQLMQGSGGGGCLSSGECRDFEEGRTGEGGLCQCHAEAEVALTDGMACTEGAGAGVCSGGRCGLPETDAGLHLVAAAEPGVLQAATPDDAVVFSGLTGGWAEAGSVGESMAPQGLAYAASRETLYAVASGAGSDELLILDPENGAVSSHVGETGFTGLVALAFDPGLSAGPDDDVLYALRNDGTGFEDLIAIDPDTAVGTNRGGLSLGMPGVDGFESLAFDSRQRLLFGATPLGDGSLLRIDPSCPFNCATTQVAQIDLPRFDPALAYSEETGLLYLVGSQANDRVLYNTIDPQSFETSASIGIQALSVDGLAAVPVPEPAAATAVAVATIFCLWGQQRSRRARA